MLLTCFVCFYTYLQVVHWCHLHQYLSEKKSSTVPIIYNVGNSYTDNLIKFILPSFGNLCPRTTCHIPQIIIWGHDQQWYGAGHHYMNVTRGHNHWYIYWKWFPYTGKCDTASYCPLVYHEMINSEDKRLWNSFCHVDFLPEMICNFCA